jgi:hypothetical protein
MVLGWPTGSKSSLEIARLDEEDRGRERERTVVEAAVAGRSDALGENRPAPRAIGSVRRGWGRLLALFGRR